MSIIFRANGQTITVEDCEQMSNEELHSLLKERVPAVAEITEEVNESNRETVIAFFKLLFDEPG